MISSLIANLDAFVQRVGPLGFAVTGFLLWLVVFLSASGFLMLIAEPLLIRLGWVRRIDETPLRPGQLRREILYSVSSVAISGCVGGILIWGYQSGFLLVDWNEPSWLRIALEVAALTLWNELYFYGVHRLLHLPVLFRNINRINHASIRTTPFSAFCFHPVKAFLLNCVLLVPLLFFHVHIVSILVFPAINYPSNLFGHWNLELSGRSGPIRGLASVTAAHADHHKRVRGNFGFWLPQLDRWSATGLSRRAD